MIEDKEIYSFKTKISGTSVYWFCESEKNGCCTAGQDGNGFYLFDNVAILDDFPRKIWNTQSEFFDYETSWVHSNPTFIARCIKCGEYGAIAHIGYSYPYRPIRHKLYHNPKLRFMTKDSE